MSRGLFPEKDMAQALTEKTFGLSPKSTAGGSVDVPFSAVIAMDLCWCGRPKNHAWPGSDEGAPHPRYPD